MNRKPDRRLARRGEKKKRKRREKKAPQRDWIPFLVWALLLSSWIAAEVRKGKEKEKRGKRGCRAVR